VIEENRKRLTVACVEGTADDGPSLEDTQPGSEGDRSLLVELNQQQIIDMISKDKSGSANRKFSVGSVTDTNGALANSFSSKESALQGSAEDFGKELIGYACKKGLKPESPNQDSFFICKAEDQFSIFGVFDGHGRKGHDISNFVKDHLPKILVSNEEIMEDPVTSLSNAFQRTQKLIEHATNMQTIDASRSGTTASVVLHDIQQNIVHIAHVGDSRVVLAKTTEAGSGEDKWQAVDLTEDHKPNLPAEKARIEQMGGQVIFDGGYNYRVYAKGKRYPGLNMSRAMGDLVGFYDAGISCMPEIASHHVGKSQPNGNGQVPQEPSSPRQNGEAKAAAVMGGAVGGPSPPGAVTTPDRDQERRHTSESHESSGGDAGTPSGGASVSSHSLDPISDKFLLICSDGVWEFISSKEAVEAVARFRKDQAMEAAEYLATMSWDRWMHYMRGEVVDDITVVIVHLSHSADKSRELS
jgi:serine/threonine protein phosphatase PrpC